MTVKFNREQAIKVIEDIERQFLELQNPIDAPKKSRSMWALFFSGKNSTSEDSASAKELQFPRRKR